MNTKQVAKLSAFERYIYWIKERESIRLKKEAGKPKPWTDDEILRSYRFCNVRRMDDKVSKWLDRNWYTPNIDHPNMVVACTLARQLNNPESLSAVGFPKAWNPTRVEEILNKRAKAGLKNFSGAYMITGTLGGTKIQQIVHKVVDVIAKDPPVLNTNSMEESVKALLPYPGFSTFIAGQVVADLRWAIEGKWADRNTWAAIGPGSRRGMNRLLGRDLLAHMKQEQFNDHLAGLVREAKAKLPSTITSRLEMIDWQNCLCEFDKYTRTMLGEGRPKQKYDGGTDPCLE